MNAIAAITITVPASAALMNVIPSRLGAPRNTKTAAIAKNVSATRRGNKKNVGILNMLAPSNPA